MADLVVRRVLHHLSTLPDQPIGQYATRATLEAMLREPAPEEGSSLESVLARFDEQIVPHACHVSHPRFLAFVPGAPTLASVLGDWLCAGHNFFAGVWLESSACAQVELVVLDWFRDMLGMPASTGGILTSGGSEANLTALVVARDRLPFADRGRAVLYASRERHSSIDRAANVIGLSPGQVRLVGIDAGHRLDVADLRRRIADDRAAGLFPWLLVGNAGTTNTGAVDPLGDLADLCQNEGIWLHIDGAYGWAAVLDPEGRRALAGVERADSITLDPHKWLAQPFEVGCLLVRDGGLLPRTFAIRPDYLQDTEPEIDEVNFADHGIALTRRFRALKVWLSMQVLGLAWFRRHVTRCMALAHYAETALILAGFEILSPASLSVVCFRAGREGADEAAVDRANLDLAEAVRRSQEAFIASTRIGGRVALRLCFVNWRTTVGDVDRVVGLMRRLAGKQEFSHR